MIYESMRFYMPALATDMKQIEAKLGSFEPLENYAEMGIDYVLPSTEYLEEGKVNAQLENTEQLLKRRKITHANIHSPFRPLNDINFLYAPERTADLVTKTIDFATRLPEIISHRSVTIHLNTLVKPDNWRDDLEYYQHAFESTVKPYLSKIIAHGKNNGVDILIETMPLREYGDSDDPELYELLEPYPILPNRGIPDIRSLGGNICVDTSHSDVAARAVRYCHTLQKMGIQNARLFYGLFKEDMESLPKNFNLFHYLEHLKEGDHLHLSGSEGLFIHHNLAKSLGVKPSFHTEGVELGKDNMTKDRIAKIIKIAEDKDVDITLEIDVHDQLNPIQLNKSCKFIAELYKTGYL